MPGFDLSDAIATITPESILMVALAGFAVGLILWEEITIRNVAFVLTSGTVFLLVFTVARWIAREPAWERPIGIVALWWWFVAVKYAASRLRRRVVGERSADEVAS